MNIIMFSSICSAVSVIYMSMLPSISSVYGSFL